MNVLRLPILITSTLLLSGCVSLWPFGQEDVKPVEIVTQEIKRTPLNLPDPAPLQPQELNWIVITPENAEQVWTKLQENNTDLVLIALTDEGYESLAVTMAEIRNYIMAQRTIIVKYREYYETPEDPTTSE